jgi:hypothetical protein
MALSRTAPIEPSLHGLKVERISRWAAINHYADTAAVRFAKGGYAVEMAEGVWHEKLR